MRRFRASRPPLETELLILSDGRIFVHNLTQPFAGLLNKLNPADGQIASRAAAGKLETRPAAAARRRGENSKPETQR